MAQATLDMCSSLLGVAVPLRIAELYAMEWWERELTLHLWKAEAEEAGVFSEAMLYRSETPGQTARAFNGLARALAALAFVPGGVRFGGLRFVAPALLPLVWEQTQE